MRPRSQITLGPSRTGVRFSCFITEATATIDTRTPRLPHLGSEAEEGRSADYLIPIPHLRLRVLKWESSPKWRF
jgi:hypothetical protein